MAEERLIDDDKDRKYKIRKNADGEDELYTDEPAEDEVSFEVPEFYEDDEEAAVMTPEQLAAREKAREEEEKNRKQKLLELTSRAKELMAEGDFAGALNASEEAEELDSENGEVYALQLIASLKNFNDFSDLEPAAKAARGVEKFCGAEQKAELLKEGGGKLKAEAEKTAQSAEKLGAENDEKKAERRGAFKERRKRAAGYFAATGVPFVLFLIVAAVMSGFMYSRKDGVLVIVTIVFFALAGLCFIASLFTARKLWDAVRNYKRNESNLYTKIGREYEQTREKLLQLNAIYAAFNDVCADNAPSNGEEPQPNGEKPQPDGAEE